jgi:hypothetical protein
MGTKGMRTQLLSLCALAGIQCLTSCSGPLSQPSQHPSSLGVVHIHSGGLDEPSDSHEATLPLPLPSSVVYLIGSVDTAIKGYAVQTSTDALPISTLTYSRNYYGGAITIDSDGQLYAAVTNTSASTPRGQIWVYPPNFARERHSRNLRRAPLLRTIDLSTSGACALAVDSKGLLYVGFNPAADSTQVVEVYSATARGPAIPLRTFAVTGIAVILDIAVNTEGNIYIAGYSGNGDNAIAVYSPESNGPTAVPTRTITFPNSNVYGVAVDASGDIFANVCRNCDDTSIGIEEFTPSASGAASPVRTINLPSGSAGRFGNGGPVRLDSVGNIFTTAEVYDTNWRPKIVVFGFGPDSSGDAGPFVQITPADPYSLGLAFN